MISGSGRRLEYHKPSGEIVSFPALAGSLQTTLTNDHWLLLFPATTKTNIFQLTNSTSKEDLLELFKASILKIQIEERLK